MHGCISKSGKDLKATQEIYWIPGGVDRNLKSVFNFFLIVSLPKLNNINRAEPNVWNCCPSFSWFWFWIFSTHSKMVLQFDTLVDILRSILAYIEMTTEKPLRRNNWVVYKYTYVYIYIYCGDTSTVFGSSRRRLCSAVGQNEHL